MEAGYEGLRPMSLIWLWVFLEASSRKDKIALGTLDFALVL